MPDEFLAAETAFWMESRTRHRPISKKGKHRGQRSIQDHPLRDPYYSRDDDHNNLIKQKRLAAEFEIQDALT